MENKFKEKPIRIHYWDNNNKIKMTGSYIIIIDIPLESIFLNENRLLINEISNI